MEDTDFTTPGAARTARWRAGLRHRNLPESDDIDTACATTLAIYAAQAAQRGADGEALAAGLQDIVVRSLTKLGYCSTQSREKVVARMYYLDMCARHPDASGKEKRQWELGPPPPELIWERDITADPDDDDSYGRYVEHPDEGAFDGD